MSILLWVVNVHLSVKSLLRYRGSCVGAYVLLNLINELGKRDKMRGLQAFYLFFAMSLINSIIQEHEC